MIFIYIIYCLENMHTKKTAWVSISYVFVFIWLALTKIWFSRCILLFRETGTTKWKNCILDMPDCLRDSAFDKHKKSVNWKHH